MILTVMHRPTEKETAKPLYSFQQKCVHDLKIKATLLLTPQTLMHQEIVEDVKKDHEKYGDEIALYLFSMDNEELGG